VILSDEAVVIKPGFYQSRATIWFNNHFLVLLKDAERWKFGAGTQQLDHAGVIGSLSVLVWRSSMQF